MSGVTVRLFDSSDTEVASTVTDAEGAYAFTGLRPGVYHVEVDIPDGFAASPQDFVVSPDDEIDDELFDSDIDDEGVMDPTALVSAEDDPRWDAGLHRAASIGDLVWEDQDGDGIQDGDEAGIAGVTVHLFDADGIAVGSTVTDGAGGFTFVDLAAGVYHLRVDIPEGYGTSPQDAGGDDAVDSDIDDAGVMAPTNLDPDEHDARWDAGLVPTS